MNHIITTVTYKCGHSNYSNLIHQTDETFKTYLSVTRTRMQRKILIRVKPKIRLTWWRSIKASAPVTSFASSSELTKPSMEFIQASKSRWSLRNRCKSYESRSFSLRLLALAVSCVHSSLISCCLVRVCSAVSGWVVTRRLAISSSCLICRKTG